MRCDEGKTRYETHAAATKMAIVINWDKWRKEKPAVPLRAYPCPFCKTWHLTSQPQNDGYIRRMSGRGKNPELAAKLALRAKETPIFDAMMRTRLIKGKVFR